MCLQFNADVKDLENDSLRLFELLLQVETFDSSFSSMTSPIALLECIHQAISVLVLSEHNQRNAITSRDNFVLSYILQLMVCSMCKLLMQVMVPEGLIKFWKSIPCSYLHVYLYHQDHFNFKDVIDREVVAPQQDASRYVGV